MALVNSKQLRKPISGSFTGSFSGDGSGLINIASASYAVTASYLIGQSPTASYALTASYVTLAQTASFYNTKINNFITVGTSGSKVNYNSIKSAVDSITDASATNPYTVKVAPGVYIEDTITLKSWVSIKGESHTTTIVSASNPDNSVFVLADQSLLIDMQIQGSTSTGSAAVVYSSPTTPQTNAIAYVENVRFGANYTHAKTIGTSGGNCIMQCSNVKYGGYPFTLGFHVTNDGSGIGRMQLRNVTSTNGGVTTTSGLIFAKADQPGCTFIVNGCLLTKATGTAAGTGFWVENGGSLRLTAVNFQRWATAIYAPNTGSAPSIFGTALNFENNTQDVTVAHPSATGKIEGTDNFLKVNIDANIPLYEVGKDPRILNVAKKGGDFSSVSASVAWITGSSALNRYVIKVGPGEFIEKEIDLTNKPYVSIVGSDIQATHLMTSGSHNQFLLGNTNEISFMTLMGSNAAGKAAIVCSDIDGFALAHKLSIYDFDYGIKVTGDSLPTAFYGEYIDINGAFSYGTYTSGSSGNIVSADYQNYYLFPSASVNAIGNFASGVSSSLSMQAATFIGESESNSIAISLNDGVDLEASSIDVQDWGTGVYVASTDNGPDFKIVGSMIHNSVNYDFDVTHTTAKGRFQGISAHTKINNLSNDFFWNFLDDIDGENETTRKLSVTFADGTHTDATTLIFKGSPMGVMDGGAITVISGLTVEASAGYGYCEKAASPGVYQRLDWTSSNITLSPNTENYIYINEIGINAAPIEPSNIENIILGRVVTNNTGVELIDASAFNADHMVNKLSDFTRQALGPIYASGSITIANTGSAFKLDVSPGTYYFSDNKFSLAGGSQINFTQYYRSGSSWNRSAVSTIPNNTFDSGSSALVALSSSFYTKHTLYAVGEGIDEEYFLVVGQNQFGSLIRTEEAALPTPPSYFTDGVVPIAAIYTQSGSAGIVQVEDIRPVIGFKATGVKASSTHANLLGLSADDHTQYLLVDGTRQMTGNLGLSGSNLYNVNQVSASSVVATSLTGSLLGTSSYADNANTASYALTASYVTLSQTASYVQTAQTASYVLNAQTASYILNAISSSYAATSSYADNFTVAGTLTAQKIVVQTITSSVEFNSGSTRFGSTTANTHQFTGSVSVSGSLITNGSDVVLSNQTSSMSVLSASYATTASYADFSTTASYALTASYITTAQTASYVQTAQTSSYVQTAQTASYVLNAISASYATQAYTASNANTASYITTSQTASYVQTAQTASYVLNAISASYATLALSAYTASNSNTASYVTQLNQDVSISGSLNLSGSTHNVAGYISSSNTIHVAVTQPTLALDTRGRILYSNYFSTTASLPDPITYHGMFTHVHSEGRSYYSHGSHGWVKIWDQYNDPYLISGSQVAENISSSFIAPLAISASTFISASNFYGNGAGITGVISSSYALNAEQLDGKDSTVFATTGSNVFKGDQTITGSFLVSGSTTQIGNNTLFGNTVLSGSILISGSFPVGSYSSSVNIYGDTSMTGYLKFNAFPTNIDTSVSASYIYVSGSTGDLYFAQNSKGYNNLTRLRWLEGNLYTGLLSGGRIIAATGSTTFTISSGSGIIVTMNASLSDEPYPTIKEVQWPNLTSNALTYLTSSTQTFIGIDDGGAIIQQTSPWTDGQYNTTLQLGTVIHQNKATVNASITYPNTAYGYKQRTYDFIKAFGPLKLSGFPLVTSGSLGLTVGSGTAWADGRNYLNDPNNPSYIIDTGTTVSKIVRYYQSGSDFVQDTNNGTGYTVIDPANYNNNGTLTGVSPSTPWTVQRVFWYPNSATRNIVVYYGNTQYDSLVAAAANIPYETFNEIENTRQNAIYLGAIVIKYNGNFTHAGDYTILPGGIFRQVGGSGGGGSVASTRLTDLSDVNIVTPSDHQPLAYDTALSKWTNQSNISASISGNATTATTASYAVTASYLIGQSATASYAITSSYAVTASYVIGQSPTASYSYTSSYAVSASYTTTSSYAVSSSYAVTASYIATASYAASIGKKVRTTIPIMSTQGQSTLLTNIPAVLDELGTELRTRENLLTAVSCSLSAKIIDATSGAVGFLKVQYSTDESTWNDLHINKVDLGTASTQLTTEEAIPSGAKTSNTYLRLVTISGDGTAASNAKIGNVTLNVIYDL